MERTWAPGLNPTYRPMNDDQTMGFLAAVMADNKDPSKLNPDMEKELDQHFFIQVINKRIEVMQLPIKFTPTGKLAAMSLIDRVGSAVLLLVDCLNAYEGQTVTPAMLADLYPTGFYDDDTLRRYIDDFMNTHKTKWAHVYGTKKA